MKKTMLVMAMAIALAMSTMAGAFAEGHEEAVRATGTVEWTTGGGFDASASFDAHSAVEMYKGEDLFKTRPAKGSVDVVNHDGFNFNGTVTHTVDMGYGAFKYCGVIDDYSGTDTYNQGNVAFVMWVADNATPGEEGDFIALNRRGVAVTDCAADSFGAPGQPVTSGNLVVHYR